MIDRTEPTDEDLADLESLKSLVQRVPGNGLTQTGQDGLKYS